jgi:hypothetical protein
MGSKSKEIQNKSMVSKTDGRVVQKFTIKLTGTKSQMKKPIRGPNGSIVRFRSGEEPEAEVVTSEHVEAKNQKIDGRHGG